MKIKKKPTPTPHLNILVYGRSGSGKTPFSATIQDYAGAQETLFVSCESGETSIRHREIPIVEVDDYDDFDKVYQFLLRHIALRKKDDKENLLKLHNEFHGGDDDEPTIYKSVVVDSLTEAQVFLKYDILNFDYRQSLIKDTDNMSRADWGKVGEKTERLVRDFNKLDMHTVFTALMSEKTDKVTGKTKREPSIQGGASDKVPGVFDMVLCMKSNEDEEVDADSKILTKEVNGYLARDRFQTLPQVMLDPTIPDIFNLIYQEE